MVSPYLTTWTEVYSCTDHSSPTGCPWAGLPHVLLAMQPMPLLKNLTIHVDGAWSLTLPNLFRMTPNLTSLYLWGDITEPMTTLPTELWPKLDRLATLSVEPGQVGLDSNLLYTLVPCWGSLRTFNFKLLSLTQDDLDTLENYLVIIHSATRIEKIHIDCPDQNVHGEPWWKTLFSKTYNSHGEDRRWLSLKTFSLTDDVSQICCDMEIGPSADSIPRASTHILHPRCPRWRLFASPPTWISKINGVRSIFSMGK